MHRVGCRRHRGQHALDDLELDRRRVGGRQKTLARHLHHHVDQRPPVVGHHLGTEVPVRHQLSVQTRRERNWLRVKRGRMPGARTEQPPALHPIGASIPTPHRGRHGYTRSARGGPFVSSRGRCRPPWDDRSHRQDERAQSRPPSRGRHCPAAGRLQSRTALPCMPGTARVRERQTKKNKCEGGQRSRHVRGGGKKKKKKKKKKPCQTLAIKPARLQKPQ